MKANCKVLYEQIMKMICHEVKRSVNEMAMISPALFKDYDEFDMFSNDYYIVSKDGRYNLVDRNGKQLSDKWFETIEKHGDEIEVKTEKGQDITLTHDEISQASFNAISRLEAIKLPAYISFNDIVYIQPFTAKSKTGAKISIIAKVIYNGMELFIDKDGQLYDSEYRVFTEKSKHDNGVKNVNTEEDFILVKYGVNKAVSYMYDILRYFEKSGEYEDGNIVYRLYNGTRDNVVDTISVSVLESCSEMDKYIQRLKETTYLIPCFLSNISDNEDEILCDIFKFDGQGNIYIHKHWVHLIPEITLPEDMMSFNEKDFKTFNKVYSMNLRPDDIYAKISVNDCKQVLKRLWKHYEIRPEEYEITPNDEINFDKMVPEIWIYDIDEMHNWADVDYISGIGDIESVINGAMDYAEKGDCIMITLQDYEEDFGVRHSEDLIFIYNEQIYVLDNMLKILEKYAPIKKSVSK